MYPPSSKCSVTVQSLCNHCEFTVHLPRAVIVPLALSSRALWRHVPLTRRVSACMSTRTLRMRVLAHGSTCVGPIIGARCWANHRCTVKANSADSARPTRQGLNARPGPGSHPAHIPSHACAHARSLTNADARSCARTYMQAGAQACMQHVYSWRCGVEFARLLCPPTRLGHSAVMVCIVMAYMVIAYRVFP